MYRAWTKNSRGKKRVKKEAQSARRKKKGQILVAICLLNHNCNRWQHYEEYRALDFFKTGPCSKRGLKARSRSSGSVCV